jgi:hypothetical protein
VPAHHTFEIDPWPPITGSRARWSEGKERGGSIADWAHMAIEFLHGRPLSPDDLGTIRREIGSFDDIGVVDDEIRGIVARNWPHLLSKLPPEDD